MHEHKEPKNQVQWKLSSNAGAIREDEVAVLVVVAAMVMVAADKDNVGINLTTVQDAVVAATPLIVVEDPLPRNEEVTPRTTGIFTRAEPTTFAVPQPSFGRSC